MFEETGLLRCSSLHTWHHALTLGIIQASFIANYEALLHKLKWQPHHHQASSFPRYPTFISLEAKWEDSCLSHLQKYLTRMSKVAVRVIWPVALVFAAGFRNGSTFVILALQASRIQLMCDLEITL